MVSSKTERDVIEKTGKSSQVEGGKVKNKATGKEEAKTWGKKESERAKRGEVYLLFSRVTSRWPELRNSSVSGCFTITLASLLQLTRTWQFPD